MNPNDQQPSWQPNHPDSKQPPVSDYPSEMYTPAEEALPVEQSNMEPVPEVAPVVEEPPISWQAKEYIEHEKGAWWYVVASIVAIGLIALDLLLVKSYTFTALVVVMSVALFLYTKRPARTIQYTLSGRQGLYADSHLYHLSDFRAFGILQDGNQHAIVLIPVKRFAFAVMFYFPESAGEQIVDILGQRLPMEKVKLDAIDILVRKLRM